MDRLTFSKPANCLTREDFVIHPIWEWVPDDEFGGNSDESFVRPTHFSTIPQGEFRQYLVSSVAILKNKSEMPACVEVSIQGSRMRFAPQFIFLFDRQLEWISDETDRLLSRYTKHLDNRPVKWRLAAPIEGETTLRKGKVSRYIAYLYAFLVIAAVMVKVLKRQ